MLPLQNIDDITAFILLSLHSLGLLWKMNEESKTQQIDLMHRQSNEIQS